MPENSNSVLTIKITPRSPKNDILGIMEDGTIKIRLTAPPVDGKANNALIDFLSEILDIQKDKILILSGHTSRTKMISFRGANKSQLIEKISKMKK